MNPATITFHVPPMGKPRMTRRDSWAKRPCVVRYWEFKDALKAILEPNTAILDIIDDGIVYRVDWIAYFPIPKSWSKKKKAAHYGQIHQQKPDRDNVDKAILDAIFVEDSVISDGRISKRWDDGAGPRIEITFHETQNVKFTGQRPQPETTTNTKNER
jgi:Holliday junction resolvase RusA-like endonuclease